MKKIIVIGANVAGLNCALKLNMEKFSVVVIDKSKNPGLKPCAGGISSKCNMYIPRKFYKKKFDNIYVHYKKNKIKIDRKRRPLHTYDREEYVKELIRKCKEKGVKVILGEEVVIRDLGCGYVITKGKKYEYDILIGADGAESVVRKRLMLVSKYVNTIEAKTKKVYSGLHMFIDHKFKGGYFWIFPHKGYSSIGCGGDIMHFKRFCKDNGIKYYEPKGARIQYNFLGYKFGDTYLIGEAAGYASALTGEGVYYSIVSGIDLAKELNTGEKSKRMIELANKLKSHQIVKGNMINVFMTVFMSFSLGRKLIEKICEKLSVK